MHSTARMTCTYIHQMSVRLECSCSNVTDTYSPACMCLPDILIVVDEQNWEASKGSDTHIHTCVRLCTCVCACARVRVRTTCARAYLHARTYVCTCVHTYGGAYAHTCLHAYPQCRQSLRWINQAFAGRAHGGKPRSDPNPSTMQIVRETV